MVDFAKLGKGSASKTPSTMLDTFNRLDRQVSHVELRPSQLRIFEQLDANAEKRDLVVKLNTGGGKTTTGLIYLRHKTVSQRETGVYLVPTIQLANQVIEEGKRVGINVVLWGPNDSHPPEDALTGHSLIVCTYEKFFNGRSTFGRADVRLTPGAIVLDDVHAGIESVRKCFCARLSGDLRSQLIDLLESDLKTLEPANWTRIELNDPAGILEVSHWVLQAHIEKVRALLAKNAVADDLAFAWPHLSKALELCRLVFTGTEAAITLDPPALQFVPHYVGARHRMYMSASIQDGSALIRELDCDPTAAAHPIDIAGEGSVGERMVIVPSLADPNFSREQLAEVLQGFVATTNVVVLVPSFAAAKFWEEQGASVATRANIEAAVRALRENTKGQYWVFAQRYDGIDLPDSSCRVLVVDGLPQGEGVIDRSDSDMAGGFVGIRGKIANRVEQGLGRAVRSSSDYCAVLLAGRDIANFISRRVVLENFSPLTVRQIEIGREISSAVGESENKVQAVVDTVKQCLLRDPSWREYYAAEILRAPENVKEVIANAATGREVAMLERNALQFAIARDYPSAASALQSAANLVRDDRLRRAVLKQRTARALYMIDPGAAMELQAAAYADNTSVSRPPIQIARSARRVTPQSEAIAGWVKAFDNKNGALVELDQLRARLAFANGAAQVEAAVEELGRVLGAESSRPEKEEDRGPDNLWTFGDVAFCIEMKSDKVAPLSKTDAGQIGLSAQWCEQNLIAGTVLNIVIGTNVPRADAIGDVRPGSVAISQDGFIEMLDRLRAMLVALTNQGPLFSEDAAAIQRQLGPMQLLPAQLLQLGSTISQG